MNQPQDQSFIICPSCKKELTRKKRFCIYCSFDLSTIKGYFQYQTLPPGFVLNKRYRVKEYITSGGMANVYKVEDSRLMRTVCLKEMMDDFKAVDERERAVQRFKREARILFDLRHPAIPRMLDEFVDGNRYYLVMDFINGRDLETILKKEHPTGIPQERAVRWLWQIIDVLGYLHGREPQVIYRDLKPSNILSTDRDQIYLIDFGIARTFMPEKKGTLIGTPGYAPPEQYKGQVDHRSDIYALGATFHHLLSGKDPREEIPFNFTPIKKIIPSLDDALGRVIDGSLTYGVFDRIQNVDEITRILSVSSIVNEAQVSYNQGMALIKENRLEEAEKAFSEAIEFNPSYAYAYFMRGSVREQREDPQNRGLYFNGAIEDYEAAIRLQPDNPDFYDSLAMLQKEAGMINEAIETLEMVLKLDPGFYEASGDLGQLYFQQGNLERAIELFKGALAANPGFQSARDNLEKARRELRIRKFDQTSGEVTDPGKAFYKLAMYFMEFERYPEAEAEFKRALGMFPDDPDLFLGLGALHLRTDKPAEALEIYLKGQSKNPGNIEFYEGVARCRIRLGKPKEAEKSIKKGIESFLKSGEDWDKNPGFQSLAQLYLDFLSAQGRDSQEIRDVQRALDSGLHLKKAFMILWDADRKALLSQK